MNICLAQLMVRAVTGSAQRERGTEQFNLPQVAHAEYAQHLGEPRVAFAQQVDNDVGVNGMITFDELFQFFTFSLLTFRFGVLKGGEGSRGQVIDFFSKKFVNSHNKLYLCSVFV
jgi:hypothetical protein